MEGQIELVTLPEPRTLNELAARAVENARSDLEYAAVVYAGALKRQQMIAASGTGDRLLAGASPDAPLPDVAGAGQGK